MLPCHSRSWSIVTVVNSFTMEDDPNNLRYLIANGIFQIDNTTFFFKSNFNTFEEISFFKFNNISKL